MEKLSSNNAMDIKRQSQAIETECRICGAPAIYSYFGVISCEACKIFFKRNAKQGQKALKCSFNGHCEINPNNRHLCFYCRLVKCFRNGMQIEMFRPSHSKTNRKNQKRKEITDLVETKVTTLVRFNQPKQLPTLNLLRSDQSTLTVDQWNLLSNITNCYDEYSVLSEGERVMREQNLLPFKMRFKSTAVIELVQIISNGGQLLYKNNRDFLSLSADDRSTLFNNTFKHTGCLSSNFISRQIGFTSHPIYNNTLSLMLDPRLIPNAKHLANRLNFDTIIIKLFLAIFLSQQSDLLFIQILLQ